LTVFSQILDKSEQSEPQESPIGLFHDNALHTMIIKKLFTLKYSSKIQSFMDNLGMSAFSMPDTFSLE
jgi:hypothetical protein